MDVPEGWAEIEGALQREFRFKDFSAAINFVNRLAEVAETAGHHPDISIHWEPGRRSLEGGARDHRP
jgi:4a-hydroxytetrahydrobiopterin dehydratase